MYKINKSFDGIETIQRTNDDGSLTFIPLDESNSDYQVYLKSLEPKAKAPKVVDEAAPV
jgi:hypothetical protein